MLQILLTFNSLLSESSKCIQYMHSSPIKMLIYSGAQLAFMQHNLSFSVFSETGKEGINVGKKIMKIPI